MTKNPLISVVIPVYNRSDMILRALDSVHAQTYRNYELIVVNDGSTDATERVLRELASDIILINTENRGVSAARNIGIENAKGEWIAFLDSDDLWMEDKLQKQIYYIEENPKIRIFQSDEVWIRNSKRHNPKKKHQKIGGDIFIPSLSLCLVSPSAVIIHKDIFSDYGLFDENMPVCEDYDLWLRIAYFEQIGLLDEKLVVKYGGHEDQLSASKWGMDRYRIYSMLKIYNKQIHDNISTDGKLNALKLMILEKADILLKGAEKRKNTALSEGLGNVKIRVQQNCNCKDCQFLLQE